MEMTGNKKKTKITGVGKSKGVKSPKTKVSEKMAEKLTVTNQHSHRSNAKITGNTIVNSMKGVSEGAEPLTAPTDNNAARETGDKTAQNYNNQAPGKSRLTPQTNPSDDHMSLAVNSAEEGEFEDSDERSDTRNSDEGQSKEAVHNSSSDHQESSSESEQTSDSESSDSSSSSEDE